MFLIINGNVLGASSSAAFGNRLFLNKYKAEAAYSLDKLSKSYDGPVVRIRRSSDNAERDFTAELLNSDLLTWSQASDFDNELLLDEYSGAAAAYSLRYLTTNYVGPVVRVRRDVDNAEEDFNVSELTDGTLTDWVNNSSSVLDQPLLNEYPGASAAYSLRELSSTTTNVVRLRREIDGVERDFTADELTNGIAENWTKGYPDNYNPETDNISSLLTLYPGAAAAFALTDLNGTDPFVVELRRSIDDSTRDFRASEINSDALINWVNGLNDDGTPVVQPTGLLDDYTGAAFAAAPDILIYSSYAGPTVRVRRDLDNTERDFTAEEVSNGTLENWVNGLPDDWSSNGILDGYEGAAFAAAPDTLIYSSYTGPTVRVRRDSDNTERDFTAEEVSNGDLVLWVGNTDIDYVPPTPPTPSTPGDPADYPDFRILVNTANAGVSNNDQFQFTGALGDYDVEVWDSTGSTKLEDITGLSDQATITIAAGANTYELRVFPAVTNGFNRIQFNGGGDKDKLLEIRNWGEVAWSTMERSFRGCSNLTTISSFTSPDFSLVTTLFVAFQSCSSLTTVDASDWNTVNVEDMSFAFQNCTSLTTFDASGWNTANVETMSNMFRSCGSPDIIGIEDFNIGSVTTFFNFLFLTTISTSSYDNLLINYEAQAPNPNLSFHGGKSKYTAGGAAEAARYSLINTYGWTITDGGSIDLSDFRILVDTTQTGISNSDQFNFTGALGNYDVHVYDQTGTTKLQEITGLSNAATITIAAGAGTYELRVFAAEVNGFNRIQFNLVGDRLKLLEIRNWGEVVWSTMNSAFRGCSNMTSVTSFVNPDLASVTNMAFMFSDCNSLTTLDVSGFSTANVTNMDVMFSGCTSLTTLDVSGFNTANVTSMAFMFRSCNSLTRLDVSGFNTANVINMGVMFFNCSSLTDISGIENFNISSVTNLTSFLVGTTLPTSRYDALLINYNAQAPNPNLSFHGGNSKYTAGGAAEAARNNLATTYNWTITDGGNPNGYVTTLYDQSGSSNHAIQGTAANQPKIVDAGSLVMDNGKAALDFDGNDNFNIQGATTLQSFSVLAGPNKNGVVIGGNDTATYHLFFLLSEPALYLTNNENSDYWKKTPYVSSSQSLFYADYNTMTVYENGSNLNGTVYSGNGSANAVDMLYIGRRLGGTFYTGKIQLITLYPSDQSSNRTAIETVINNEYNIYPSTNNGYVVTLYDQSGNGNHATQSTAANQPKIVDAGSLVMENGKAALDFDGVDDWLFAPSTFPTGDILTTTFFVCMTRTGASSEAPVAITPFATAVDRRFLSIGAENTLQLAVRFQGGNTVFDAILSFNQSLFCAYRTAPNTDFFARQNATQLNVQSSGAGKNLNIQENSAFMLGAAGYAPYTSPISRFDGNLQISVWYLSDNSANVAAIETAINTTYNNIYTPTKDAYVSKWYDQSGNGNHAIQTEKDNQPMLVDDGVLITENGKAALNFDNLNQLVTSDINWVSAWSVSKANEIGTAGKIFSHSLDFCSLIINSNFFGSELISDGLGNQALSGFNDTAQKLLYGFGDGTNIGIARNSGSVTSNPSTRSLRVDRIGNMRSSLTDAVLGRIQLILIYPSNQSANRTAIETIINNEYSIYPLPAANAYVSTWYDQSGNNNHAVQSALDSQPILIENGILIVENGKPAVKFDGIDDTIPLNTEQILSNINNLSSFLITSGDVLTGDSLDLGSANNNARWYLTYRNDFGYGDNPSAINLGTLSITDTRLMTAIAGSTQGNAQAFVNGESKGSVALQSAVPNPNSSFIASYLGTSRFYSGYIYEVIIYNSDKSLSRVGIETNINNYYNIYSDLFNAYVTTWYDQSGNANNVVQSIAIRQPKIVSDGQVILKDGKPGITFDGIDDKLVNLSFPTFTEYLQSSVVTFTNITEAATGMLSFSAGGNAIGIRQSTVLYDYEGSIVGQSSAGAIVVNERIIFSSELRSNYKGVYKNSLELNSNTGTATQVGGVITIGGVSPVALSTFMIMQELVVYPTNQSSNRVNIETNINEYYNIYDLPSAYITTWYDQSGNGINITQSNSINQPIVVDQGVLVDRVYFNGSSTYMNISAITLNQPFVFSIVVDPTISSPYTKNTIVDFGTYSVEIDDNTVLYTDAGNPLGSDTITEDKVLYTIRVDSTTTEIYRNNVLIRTGNAGINDIGSTGLLGLDTLLTNYYEGRIESIFFHNSSDITNINKYINDLLAVHGINQEPNYSVFVWDSSTPSPDAV